MIRGGLAPAHRGYVSHAATDHAGISSSSARVVPNLLTELTRVLEDVAAVRMPDEGMRGTAADERKLQASLDGELHAKLALALTMAGECPAGSRDGADVQELVEVASRVIRSISITPDAAERVANRVAGGCVVALRARCGLRWLLAAMVRLAQHAEAHPALLRAGAVAAVVAAWAPDAGQLAVSEVLPLGAFDSTPRTARLDLVGYILLSFLSESEAAAHAVAMVPAQAVPHLVRALDERLALAPGPAEAEEQVARGLFFGLPLYYRPRFIVQGLANLAKRSDPHCAACWDTNLPVILQRLHNGELANDTRDNVPYGSPDAVELAHGLASSLLRYQRSHTNENLGSRETCRALVALAHGPTDGLAGWTLQRRGAGVGSSHGPPGPTFRGCSAVSDHVGWVTGSHGSVLRTTDGGASWIDVSPHGLGDLDFRDVHAFSEHDAVILSIGFGESSRILRTGDGGSSWATMFINKEEGAFYNFLGFYDDRQHGIAFSDTVDGCFRIITTSDGGANWHVVPQGSLPPALEHEGAFAASGKNMALRAGGLAWIGMGASAGHARVLRSVTYGQSWQISTTPIRSGPSAGIFSLTFCDCQNGVAVGGDYQLEDEAVNVAVTADGGISWELAAATGGFRSVAAYIDTPAGTLLLALGPSGADVSKDNGRSWMAMQTPWRGLHTYSQGEGAARGFAAGAGGGIAGLGLVETILASPKI